MKRADYWDVDKRIERMTTPIPECGCIVWLGHENYGYGILSVKGRTVRAHRYVYEKENGPVPEGLGVLHRCDVRLCINPRHLYAGTHDDNMDDRQNRNRQAKGEKAGQSKLIKGQVLEIRRIYAETGCTFESLSTQYGVSDTTIHAIINRRTWKHI